ncbi:uncharacterized protein LOC116251602 [Nymphaea colorata]|uniref:uncharacterized protein LOC116251602 n=1 Tax=Nymphaea colorata TaxID=210225 RepID=UPI00129DA766|nr:uncharacterized protein LOC116251602 [Nymphaea colorata]XP_031481824.1 uncharacterized protein LOC116251602 [Nymphaea colorata]
MGGIAWEAGCHHYLASTSSIPLLHSELLPTSAFLLSCRWRMKNSACLLARRGSSRNFRVFAESTVSSGNGTPGNKVVMVDPLEAKRLAAKQMEMLKSKEKFQNQRQIEAINGAWAIIGLTAGVVIEGRTGHGILAQLAGYWMALSLFLQKFITV